MRLLPNGRDRFSIFKKIQSAVRSGFVGVACAAVVLQPLTADFAMAQSITVDPTAPRANRAGITRSSTGKPTINIVAPNAGVSLNRYKTLSTNSGAIFNNSSTGGTTKTGGTVKGNANLKTAGTAKVIVNEVRGTARSTVKGTLEVFGAKADVIIANQNGITCDGCSFVNTGRATLSTGSVAVSGSNVNLNVKKGVVTVGRGGMTGADAAQLAGRHVIIDGKVVARNSITASGGAQRFDARTGRSYAAPSDKARNAPYAVDATSFGSLQAGSIRVIGNESGLGVRLDGRMIAGSDAVVSSRGDVAVRNVTAKRNIYIGSSGSAQQTKGVISAGGNITVSARRFATSPGAQLVAGGVVTIKTNDTLTVGGEIRAKQINVTTANSTLNVGRVIAAQELTIVAGDITNRRAVTQTNITYYSGINSKYIPWIKDYIRRYPTV